MLSLSALDSSQSRTQIRPICLEWSWTLEIGIPHIYLVLPSRYGADVPLEGLILKAGDVCAALNLFPKMAVHLCQSSIFYLLLSKAKIN